MRLAAGGAPVAVKRRAVNWSTKVRTSLYNYNYEVKEDEMGTACKTHGGRNPYVVFVGKLEGKRPVGRPRIRWENTIKMDVRGIE
jgi:hypothetical protein